MAKGDYRAIFGGSRNAYEKGKRDAQKTVWVQVGNALVKILNSFVKGK